MDSLVGAIPRVERQQTHYEFLWNVKPPAAMIGLNHAARVAMHDQQFFPNETDIVLTSTISDSKLATYSFEDELRIIHEIEPDWIIPFDFPVYGDMDSETRTEHVRQVSNGARDLQYILNVTDDSEIETIANIKQVPRHLIEPELEATVIPLIKGVTKPERKICTSTAEEMNAPIYAKYGTQYMTVGGNGSYPQLCRDLAKIQEESNNHPLLVIGLLSPNGKFSLEGVPDNITAAAGTNQWLKHVEPKSSTPAEMRDKFDSFYSSVSETLTVTNPYDVNDIETQNEHPDFKTSRGKAVNKALNPSLSGAAGKEEYGFGQRKRSDDAMSASEAGKKGVQIQNQKKTKLSDYQDS